MKKHEKGAAKTSSRKRTGLIMASLIIGIVVGCFCHRYAASPAIAKEIAGYFGMLTDIFLRMIRMIIAPLVFATIVSGITDLRSSGGAVGRITFRAMSWFLVASLISLALGLVVANVAGPGHALGLALPAVTDIVDLPTAAFSLKDFVGHVFPSSIVQAFAGNEVLQIVVFSTFFGEALSTVAGDSAKTLSSTIKGIVPVMLRVTDYVMRFAPVGVFSAIAAVVTVQGPGILWSYGNFVATFYLASGILWILFIGVGLAILGKPVFRLIRLLQEPMAIAFSTASSEAAFPKMFEQLLKFGVAERVSAFVLPLGYSFNLAGSMVYQAVATVFVAQAYGIELTLAKQVTMLLIMLVASKGIAGVPRASLVVVAATLPMFGLPASGLLLILGIDQLLDMGRALTNVLSNGIATAAVATWEGEIGASSGGQPRETDAPHVHVEN